MKAVRLTRPPRKASVTATAAVADKGKKLPGINGGMAPLKGGSAIPPITRAGSAAKDSEEILTEILALASKLDSLQIREVISHLSLAVQEEASGQSRDKDMWSTAVYEALQAALGGADRAGVAPMLLRRAMGAPAAWLPVGDFMKAAKLDEHTVTERASVYAFLARLLVRRARSVAQHVGAPLTPKLVANQAPQLAALFDLEFPGYLAAGLAGVVAKRIVAGHQRDPEDD